MIQGHVCSPKIHQHKKRCSLPLHFTIISSVTSWWRASMIYPDASTIIPEFHDIYIYTYYIYISYIYICIYICYIIYIYILYYIYIYSHCLVVKTHQNWWWGLSKTPIQNLRSLRALLSISKDCRNFAESCNRERTSRWMDSKHSLDRSGSGSFDTQKKTHPFWLAHCG